MKPVLIHDLMHYFHGVNKINIERRGYVSQYVSPPKLQDFRHYWAVSAKYNPFFAWYKYSFKSFIKKWFMVQKLVHTMK